MFERTLTDVVKGIRASRRDTALYISQCIAEIKAEIASNDLYVKTNALQKLTFLQMMGYSMSWASFATIEVMASPRFGQKRVGYLAAAQGFTADTEVVLLATNLLRKELRGAVGGGMRGVYEAGLAVNCVANIVTPDLARDLLPELLALAAHPQPYLRKRAVLCLFKVFLRYPPGLRLAYPKLQEALRDPNPAVVSCAVNVITELSDKNPRNYLPLAPAFFELLTGSSNNWMLIKVVKLLGSLVPEEPRLARKLLEPLAEIVRNTQAKSLLYEAVLTVTLCLPYCRRADGSLPPSAPEVVELCAATLGAFAADADQNLKYLGLVGFASLMVSHPRVLSSPAAARHRPAVLACLSDPDVTIRRRALDLLIGMATRQNLPELVAQLLRHVSLASGAYRSDLVAKIVELGAAEKYGLVTDFRWYADVLFHLGHLRGIEAHGELLRAQVTDVALRVLPVRPYMVRRSIAALLERDGTNSSDPFGDNGRGKNILPQVLPALAWIVGEYAGLIREATAPEAGADGAHQFAVDDSSQGCYHALVQILSCPSSVQALHPNVLKVYMQSVMKVLSAATSDSLVSDRELTACLSTIQNNLPIFTECMDLEVAERSRTSLELLQSLNLNGRCSDLAVNGNQQENAGGDLLGLQAPLDSVPTAQSLSSVLRESSGILNHLYKPSAMKPVGSKAQRKKRASTTGHTINLESSVDLSVFSNWIQKEENYRSRANLGTDSVSFIQQHPSKITATHVASVPSTDGLGMATDNAAPQVLSTGAKSSFQHTVGEQVNKTAANNSRQGDPFYLSSVSSSQPTETPGSDTRFGKIQLFDTIEDENGTAKKSKKKKDKKARREHTPGVTVTSDVQQEGNLWSFGDGDKPMSLLPQTILHDSDDDDDEESNIYSNSAFTRKKGPSKEFSGLAKVDLTTPLREDELLPEPKHRVVPDHPIEKSASSKKKKKKESKKSKDTNGMSGYVVEDLLDMGGFGPNQSSAPTSTNIGSPLASVSSLPVSPVSNNPINSAFDDLLGISTPTPGPVESFSHAKNGKDRVWLSATLKVSSATAPSTSDWSAISLSYHVSNDASVVFRLENKGRSQSCGLVLTFMEGSIVVPIGDVTSGSLKETDAVCQFRVDPEESHDHRGKLSDASGNSVSVKISIPPTIHLNPQVNISLDRIFEEVSSPGWFSHTSKVKILSSAVPEDIFGTISSFLRASIVDGGTDNAATFAANSNSGTRVRALAKIKEQVVKIDIKSTNSALAKGIASDFKRLIL